MRKVRRRIAEVRKDGYASLTLLQMRLTELPAEVAELPEVTSLGLAFNQLRSLGPALDLGKLTFLSLSGNPYFASLGELKAFPELTELLLANCHIKDLSKLPKLPKLKKLDLSGNKITDLSPLADFPALDRLILDNNSVSSLRPLRHLLERGIPVYGKWSLTYSFADRYVYVKGNPLTDPPYAIAQDGTPAILRYWKVQDKAATGPAPTRLSGPPTPAPTRLSGPPTPAPAYAPPREVAQARKAAAARAREHVGADGLRAALGELRPYLLRPELLAGRLRELETELLAGTLSPAEASVRRARIREAVLVAAAKVARGESDA